ncbi:MAG: hypothetical protein LBC73_10340 [Oscillospiraceae bacterium]|nr:hypothetical protein [Oscillospiraceae bacterium]
MLIKKRDANSDTNGNIELSMYAASLISVYKHDEVHDSCIQKITVDMKFDRLFLVFIAVFI